ncbi:glycosyltransferase [Vreelandella aquamarina]|uniref:Glycosyltransferase 2-like domain-containing protein n=1 Tax=Vreelandella aquamarina TaxID=77097 RepID=A0A6F8SZK2_9GAMM|nr:glycosyltransferase [Halomonas meridiana]BCA93330.1 hypothetical protein HMSLTHF_31050 [Halomonas meridiana]
MNKKVTIVTVVKNMAKELEKCLDRYRKIKNKNIEVIVIDGNSQDETTDVLNDSHDIVDHWISENDSGIYDAMNKGINLSTGEIIVLINVDDLVIPQNFDQALKLISDNFEDADIFAFSASMVKNGKRKFKRIPRPLDPSMLFRTMPFSHNATFIKKTLYEELGLYRTDFKIVSDFFWFCYAQAAEKKVYLHDLTILESDLTGMSGSNDEILLEENIKILNVFFPFLNREELIDSYLFRKRYSGSNDKINYLNLISASKKSIKKGSNYHELIKTCINENPLSFVGHGYDFLIKNLPRNHQSRFILPAPIIKRKDKPPLVTVGITSFNCIDTIQDTITSCLNQEYPNFEIIIVDDCSTDGTIEKINKFKSEKITLYVNEKNYGVAYSRNKIAYKAKGEYVMFCDDDDVSAKDRISKSLHEINKVEKKEKTKRVICFSTRKSKQLNKEDIIIEAAGQGSVETGISLHDLVALHLLRISGKKGQFSGKDITKPLSMGTGVGFYPTQLIRDIGFNEMFRRAEDVEFCMACGCEKEPVYIVGTKEPLYFQKITQSEDKSKDAVIGFYILLSIIYREELYNRGFDTRSFSKSIIKNIKSDSLRMDFYSLLEFSNKWAERYIKSKAIISRHE